VSLGSRPVIFVVVGVAGYALQTAALWALAGMAGLRVVPATLLATEAAVLHNFVWHVRWTWADRPAGPGVSVMRLLRFNLANGGVSLAGGAAVMALLVDALGMHYLVANLVAVVACGVVNYMASDRWVFRRAGCPVDVGPSQMT
jgi:putative flippase GtrA